MTTVNCGTCEGHPRAIDCLVYMGKCFCDEICLMKHIEEKIRNKVQELREKLEPLTKEAILKGIEII
jgi:hypothetical protein